MRRPVLVPVLRRTLILCAAVLCTTALWASQASAVSITLSGANGQNVVPGDQVTVTMTHRYRRNDRHYALVDRYAL